MKRTVLPCAAAAMMACGSEQTAPGAPDAGMETIVVTTPEQARKLPPRLVGNLEISGAELTGELRIAQLTEIEGSLTVTARHLESLDLPELERVTGHCSVEETHDLQRLEVPKLTRCASLSVARNQSLEELSAAALESVSMFQVAVNPALRSVELPKLDLVPAPSDFPYLSDRYLSIRGNLALEEIELPAVRDLLELSVSSNALLRRVSLPAARGPAGVSVYGNYLLQELSLPELVGINQSLLGEIDAVSLITLRLSKVQRIESHYYLWSDSLRELALPALESVGDLTLVTPALERFEAPKLSEVDGLSMAGPHLHTVSLPALREGCGTLSIRKYGKPLPDCAAKTIVPNCAPEELELTAGCTCNPDGDLSAASCPDADAGL